MFSFSTNIIFDLSNQNNMAQTNIIPVIQYNAKLLAQGRFNMTFHNNQGICYKRGYVVEYGDQTAYFKTIEGANHFAKNPIIEIQEGSTAESRYNS